MGRIEAAVMLGGTLVQVAVVNGRVVLGVSGELVKAGAEVVVVVKRGELVTRLDDTGEVSRVRHGRRECDAVFPTGDVTLDSGEDEALDAELLEGSGEYRIERALLEAV